MNARHGFGVEDEFSDESEAISKGLVPRKEAAMTTATKHLGVLLATLALACDGGSDAGGVESEAEAEGDAGVPADVGPNCRPMGFGDGVEPVIVADSWTGGTARAVAEVAEQFAHSFCTDAALVAISVHVGSGGRLSTAVTGAHMYTFLSEAAAIRVHVHFDSPIKQVRIQLTSHTSGRGLPSEPVPAGWVDSDVVMAAAAAAGLETDCLGTLRLGQSWDRSREPAEYLWRWELRTDCGGEGFFYADTGEPCTACE